jgi:hypothetical protein
MADDAEQILREQLGARGARDLMRRRFQRTTRGRAEALPNPPTGEDVRPTGFRMDLMRGGTDTGTRYGGFGDIFDSLVTNALRVPSFIGDPSGSGRNVASQYQPGGEFSSQRSLSDLRTVIPSSAMSLTGAWSRVQPLAARINPQAGMPAYLATAARRNLAAEDRIISRFNLAGRGISGGVSAPRSITTQPNRFSDRGVDYGPAGRNLYGAYHSVLAIKPNQ